MDERLTDTGQDGLFAGAGPAVFAESAASERPIAGDPVPHNKVLPGGAGPTFADRVSSSAAAAQARGPQSVDEVLDGRGVALTFSASGGTSSRSAGASPRSAGASSWSPGAATSAGSGSATLAEGLDGWLSLGSAETLDETEAAATLVRLDALIGWAQAQQARVVARVEELVNWKAQVLLPSDQAAGAVLSATAAEVGAALRLPHVTAMRLVAESWKLTQERSATLAHLSVGAVTYPHARVLLEELQFVPPEDAPAFEGEALRDARTRTAAQLSRRVRVLRERRYPDTIRHRHRDALSKRRVWLEPAPDGMACLGAMMAAETGMALFTALSAAARARRKGGDERTMDQLRTDLLTGTLLGAPGPDGLRLAEPSGTPSRPGPIGDAGNGTAADPSGPAADPAGDATDSAAGPSGPAADPDLDLSGMKAEIMVIINTDTLFGANDQPAELSGYGAISADAARRLARQISYWTGLVQDPASGEILAVGRRRKVPAGLVRWLRARDGTCRFPGCSVSAARSEIDHTVPWSHGGTTDHDNLAHLCPKHHRLKSQGFWKACQRKPGQLTWRSVLGESYTTDPELSLKPQRADPGQEAKREEWLDNARRRRFPAVPAQSTASPATPDLLPPF